MKTATQWVVLVTACVTAVWVWYAARADGADPGQAKLHLYLLLGQSNMAGRGKVEAQDKEVHPRVFMLDASGKWVPAVEPVQFDRGPHTGVGPALAFGRAMAGHDKSARIGLVPCAVGGSPISRWQKGADLYGVMLRRAKIASETGVLKGILWHQGENDGLNKEQAEQYEANIVRMVNDMRNDLGVPDVPLVAAQLGEFFVNTNPHAKTVNEVLSRLSRLVPHAACVSARGLNDLGDKVHFNSEAARELGRRYAEAIIQLRKKGEKAKED